MMVLVEPDGALHPTQKSKRREKQNVFTGIVAGTYRVRSVVPGANLLQVAVELPPSLLHELSLGASVAIDGVCLTVVQLEDGCAFFDVVAETLARTTLSSLASNRMVNVERAARLGDELGGHLISGHVLGTAEIVQIERDGESRLFTFTCPRRWMRYILPKGFISLDGASLTVVDSYPSGSFSVAIIPETHRRTTFGFKRIGDEVNVEVDPQTQVIVDTVERLLLPQEKHKTTS